MRTKYPLILFFSLILLAFATKSAGQLCFGGQVSLPGGITSLVQCVQNDNPPLFPQNNSSATGASYIYILTNNSAVIIADFESGEGINMDEYPVSTYRIYGFSYTGTLNQSTLQPGLPYMGITSNDCFSYSSTYITVVRNTCGNINCHGGNISTLDGDTYISICSDGYPDEITFTNTGTGNAVYTYVLGDAEGNILDFLSAGSYDFDQLAEGRYSITGLSYQGQFVESSIQVGQPVSGIQTDGTCWDFSTYSIVIDIVVCELGESCTHLYFSEYIEGSQNNRALEIYNPTSFPVNLADYDIFVYRNGDTDPSPVMSLSGIIQPGGVYVVTHPLASTELLSISDITGGVATFTGNDAVALMYQLEPIDIIGVIGQDPGLSGWTWPMGNSTASTTDRTLVRKPGVNAPTTNWVLSRGQWYVYNEDNFEHIGSHTAESCDNNTYLGFENSALMVPEDIGSFEVTVVGYNILTSFEVVVSVIAGTAISDEDYVDIFPLTLNFSPTETSHTIEIEIIDDDEMEGYEYFTLKLTEMSESVVLVNQTLAITIEHSDQAYPDRTIEEITTVDSFGVADSLDVFCTIGGVVHGENLNAAGIEFTLIENHAGIKVFDPTDNFAYIVQEGDSVRIRGQVAQFFGMTYFYPDSILYVDSGHALDEPIHVTEIAEEHESAMIKLECVSLTNPSQWTNLTSGFDVDITDGAHQYVMHIDKDMNLYGMEPLKGHFNVVGIGAQHDENAPYNSGYSIWPRYLEDISDRVIASFIPGSEIVFGGGGSTVSFESTGVGGVNFLWNFGDGQTSTEENPVHFYPYSFFMGIADVMVTLTVEDVNGCSDKLTKHLDVVYSSVDELSETKFNCYPNPVTDKLIVKSEENLTAIRVVNSVGTLVFNRSYTNQYDEELDTSSWSPGVYFVSISSKNFASVKKIVKQ